MKYRTVNRIIGDTAGHAEQALLAHANRHGYLLPGGGTPWDAETMTIRLIGLDKGRIDVLAGFDPAGTFETPARPASRLPFVAEWHRPALPSKPGAKVTFATITGIATGRVGTIEIVCTGTHDWRIVVDGHPQHFTYAQIRAVQDAATSAGMVLGAALCREGA